MYTGEKIAYPAWYTYLGETLKISDDTAKKYVMKVYKSLKKKYDALAENGRKDDELSALLDEIECKIKEAELWLE